MHKQSLHHKKSIIKKIIHIGSSTLLSRFLGIAREMLTMRYLGVPGALTDAFSTAYSIPNSLRKIFAEGAISGAFIPTLVPLVKEKGMREASRFLALLFFVIESIVLLICLGVTYKTELFLRFITPGFSQEQLFYAVPLLRILIFFIFFISSASIFGGALQSVHRFFVPASAPIFYNSLIIGSLFICMYFQLPLQMFAWMILFSGFLFACLHLVAYLQAGFCLTLFNKSSYKPLREVMIKFFPVLFTVGITEINAYIDRIIGSYLTEGSVTLIYYAHRFAGIPLGVIGVAFSTIFLPYFSHVRTYAPRRLSFFMHEALKLILYVTVPITLLMALFSQQVFSTLFAFTAEQTCLAGKLLATASVAIFFQSANKTLLSLFYSLNNTWTPTLISVISTLAHIVLNYSFMPYLGAIGLIAAGALASLLQTMLYLIMLKKHNKYPLYSSSFARFSRALVLQIILFGSLFYGAYTAIISLCMLLPETLAHFFLNKVGLWLWVGPLTGLVGLAMLGSRKRFGIKLYFLD
jgi:putative peptidoglycan lipid II flippase